MDFGTPVEILRRERLTGKRLSDVHVAYPYWQEVITGRKKYMHAGGTGKVVSSALNVAGRIYYLVRLDGFPVYGQAGTVLVKSFEIQEKVMSNSFQSGQRVRVVELSAGCFDGAQLRATGALPYGVSRESYVGQTGTIDRKASMTGYPALTSDPVFLVTFEDGVTRPFFVRELEVVNEPQAETPADTTTSELETLVLQLLTIFPNNEPADVLDADSFDADPKDAATVNEVVPALRRLLRNHPVEVARRKARKEAQKTIRKVIRAAESVVELAEENVARAQAELVTAKATVEKARAQLD